MRKTLDTTVARSSTLGPVERFASARKVASYAGLVPAEYSSGGKQRLGHISKEGSVFLRWVLVEAANVALRYDHELKRVYWRQVERRGKSIAKVAMARKLLIRLYWMLRRRSQSRSARQRDRVRGPQRARCWRDGVGSQGSSRLDMAAFRGRYP